MTQRRRGFCTLVPSFINVLPEANCCCLQTCYVYALLLTLPCTYTPTFMVTTANIMGTFTNILSVTEAMAYLSIDCLRLFVVVYKLVVLVCCFYLWATCVFQVSMS